MSTVSRITKTVFLTVIALLINTQLWASDQVTSIFLVQNSGWMLPFYEDPESRLKDLVTELASRVQKYGGSEQIIASFNQTTGVNESPKLHYSGSDQNKIAEAIKGIVPAKKPGRTSYADTDFREAVVDSITRFSPGKPCILWIVTNNKNSPDNSRETVEKNKDFYSFLQDTPQIKRIVAYPYSNKVQSHTQKDYMANGLMIYAMAYGDMADQHLQSMLSQNAPFGSQPARLKPLNSEALTFLPKGVVENENVKVGIPDQKSLVLSFDVAKKPETAEIVGQFRNDFFPYDINSASIRIVSDIQGGQSGIECHISEDKIVDIPAGGLSQDFSVKISVPPLPSMWSPDVIFGSGYTAAGVIRFQLSDQQLEISKKFTATMSELFPNDPLPNLFIPGEAARSSVTEQPFLLQVVYPAWPLLLLGGGAFCLVLAIIAFFTLIRHESVYRVSVDGIQKTYALKPFKQVVIKNSSGERIGVLKRSITKAVPIPDKDKKCNIRLV